MGQNQTVAILDDLLLVAVSKWAYDRPHQKQSPELGRARGDSRPGNNRRLHA